MSLAALFAALLAPVPAAATLPDADAMTQYVRARLADASGETTIAATGYATLLTLDPQDLAMALRAYRGGIAAGDTALALRAARILDAREGLPAEGRLLLFGDALATGDYRGAQAMLAKIEAEQRFDFLAPILQAWINFGTGEGGGAALLDKRPESALTAAYAGEHRALLLLAEGQAAEGATAYRALSSQGQGTAGLAVRMAVAARLAALRDRDTARALLAGDEPVLRAASEQLRKRKKLPGAADSAAKGVALLLARLATDINRQQPTPVAVALGRAAQLLDPAGDGVRLVSAEMVAGQGDGGVALAMVTRTDPKGPWMPMAQDRRVALLVDSGAEEAALAVALDQTRAAHATSADFQRLGDIYSGLSRPGDAAGAYTHAITLADAQRGGASWALWLLKGSALHEAGDWAGAKAALERAAELGPDQPVALNYLGYSQLERRENLEEAEKLIRRASELRPGDSAITDSLGWAYYVRGNIPKAIETLERAVRTGPGEPTINEHLGDAYWTAGRRIDARYAWRAALVNAEDVAALRLRAKIDLGLTPQTAAP